MITIPLDKICVKSGVLCPRCEALVESGKYSDLDVKVMKALVEVESKYRSVDMRYVKSYQVDDVIYVLAESASRLPAGLGADIRRALGSEGISRVIVLEYRRNWRQLLSDLIAPYPLLGLQEVYLPDGSQVSVMRVPEEARPYLESVKGRYLLKLAEKLLGREVYVEYVESRGSSALKAEWLGINKPSVKEAMDRFQ